MPDLPAGEGATPARASPGDPRVTVSLVTWNGSRWLPGCLESLRAQLREPFELLVVDNGSQDDSVELVSAALETGLAGRVLRNAGNEGYAAAHNRNLREARGEFVLLLNQDVELDRGFLAATVDAFRVHPTVAAVQGRILRQGDGGERLDLIDTLGLQMLRDRRVVSRGQGSTGAGAPVVPGPVWGVDGPAPVYRRSALMHARLPRRGGGWEVLDEDFFAYKEDVDLAWRLRTLGWGAWYEPDALAWHARGASATVTGGILQAGRGRRAVPRWVKVTSWRNHHLMMLKNESLSAMVRDLPWIMRRELSSLAFNTFIDPVIPYALPGLLRSAPAALRKRAVLRRRIRAARPVSDEPPGGQPTDESFVLPIHGSDPGKG